MGNHGRSHKRIKQYLTNGTLAFLLVGTVVAQHPIQEEDSVSVASSGTACLIDADCDTGDPCRIPRCDPHLNECRNGFYDPCCPNDGICYDGDPCTLDWSCDGDEFCDYPPMSDGDVCRTEDRCMPFGLCQQGACVGPQVECPFGAECQQQGRVRCLIEPYESAVVDLTPLLGSYDANTTRNVYVDWGTDWYHLNHLDFRFSGTYTLGMRDCDGILTETRAQVTLETDPSILYPRIQSLDGKPDESVSVNRWIPYDTSGEGPVLGGRLLITFEYRARTDCVVLSEPLLVIEEFTLEYSGRRMFDANGDGLANLLDYELLTECLGGPDEPKQLECSIFDGNIDERIDLADFSSFQNSLANR